MIEARSLTRYYDRALAVDDVSFSIGDNEIVGLLGHNGAGKTTIMRMLSGYLEPSAGQIDIDGLNMATDAHIVQRQLGYLPENLPVYPDMMVADYLDYAAALKGIEPARRMGAVRAALAATDLTGRALERVSTLSRGLRQRVGVAQAILGKPRLLILDEPTRGVDVGAKVEIYRLMIELAREGMAILMISSELPEVLGMSDRILVMHEGRVADCLNREEANQERVMHLATGAVSV